MAEDKKISKAVDKLVMGMIIGGAVGSVIGMAMAPKSGKENRKIVKEKAQDMKDKVEDFGHDFVDTHSAEIRSAKHAVKDTSKGVFSFMKKTFGMKKSKKRIPHEIDA